MKWSAYRKTLEKQQKRKKDDHLFARYLWLTRAQNFDHGSYIALVEIIIIDNVSEPAPFNALFIF